MWFSYLYLVAFDFYFIEKFVTHYAKYFRNNVTFNVNAPKNYIPYLPQSPHSHIRSQVKRHRLIVSLIKLNST